MLPRGKEKLDTVLLLVERQLSGSGWWIKSSRPLAAQRNSKCMPRIQYLIQAVNITKKKNKKKTHLQDSIDFTSLLKCWTGDFALHKLLIVINNWDLLHQVCPSLPYLKAVLWQVCRCPYHSALLHSATTTPPPLSCPYHIVSLHKSVPVCSPAPPHPRPCPRALLCQVCIPKILGPAKYGSTHSGITACTCCLLVVWNAITKKRNLATVPASMHDQTPFMTFFLQ